MGGLGVRNRTRVRRGFGRFQAGKEESEVERNSLGVETTRHGHGYGSGAR